MKNNNSQKSDVIKIPTRWITITGVIILVIVLAYFTLSSGVLKSNTTGNAISEEQAKDKILNFFATEIPESTVTFISSSNQGNLYQIDVNIDGEEVPLYVTSDGQFLTVDPIPLA